jgi:hypothetical protein
MIWLSWLWLSWLFLSAWGQLCLPPSSVSIRLSSPDTLQGAREMVLMRIAVDMINQNSSILANTILIPEMNFFRLNTTGMEAREIVHLDLYYNNVSAFFTTGGQQFSSLPFRDAILSASNVFEIPVISGSNAKIFSTQQNYFQTRHVGEFQYLLALLEAFQIRSVVYFVHTIE